MQKFNTKSILSKFDFYEYESNDSANDNLDVFNPYDNSLITTLPSDSVFSAIEKINRMDGYRGEERDFSIINNGHLLEKWHSKILEKKNDLAELIVLEQGKPLAEAISEVEYGAAFIKWYSEEGKRIKGDLLESPYSDREFFVKRQPIGLVATITPWNFPLAMFARKASAALAAGCSVITKPAEDTPLTTLAMISLAREIGFVREILDAIIVRRSKVSEIGQLLCANQKISKISFTGSTAVGKQLVLQGAGTLQKFSLELGGNAPFIVREDADLDLASDELILSKFRNAGQTCVCANRIFVNATIFDKFVSIFLSKVQTIKTGSGFEAGVQIGPLINHAAANRYEKLISDLNLSGAKFLYHKERTNGGLIFEPTVVVSTKTDVRAFDEEIFGPLAVIYKFETDTEVIKQSNATNFGLASYLFTESRQAIKNYTNSLDFGIVCVNAGTFSNSVAPFGGFKESGVGREGGRYGLEEFLETKFVSIK